jgi:RimJ/RimL family protein N-acetyltransferase
MTGPDLAHDGVDSVLAGYGVVLRPWTDADLGAMVELFDDVDIAHRTPLAAPFDADAARAYLERARQAGTDGSRLQLAITTDGGTPLGEVLLNRQTGAIGYSVGAAHRRRGLALRAVRLLTEYALGTLSRPEVLLEIEPDNAASIAVARAAGFHVSGAEPVAVEDKGRRYTLISWVRAATDS